MPGESSDPRARSPLAAPGTRIQAGDLIVAVDGQPVEVGKGPGPLLVGAAGKPVELTLLREGDSKPRRAVVVPLGNDVRLRYQDWVAGRRQLVRELSGGRAGYLHVPDMVSEGWSDFHRDLRGEMEFEALIVDVRANRGGHTSQLVVEKLARRVIGWDTVRYARAGELSLAGAARPGGGGDRRVGGLGRRHRHRRHPDPGHRHRRRSANLGRRDRHLRLARARRRHAG